jgi:tetratricopeptide (TPR) repeat protein
MFREMPSMLHRFLTTVQKNSLRELRIFLEGGTGPVIPILGKFDLRKNPLWILRMLEERPDLSCVILGERMPCGQDGEINRALAVLRDRHCLFEQFEYLPERLMSLAIGHPRVPFVALPYRCHHGSSGIQLMSHWQGKPVLVPDQGLMSWRVHGHRLGRTYPPGDEAGFKREFLCLLKEGPAPYEAGVRSFMRRFTRSALWRALDVALEEKPAPLSPLGHPAGPTGRAYQAMELAGQGHLEGAAEAFSTASGPGSGFAWMRMRQAMAFFRLGRIGEAADILRECRHRGLSSDIDFFVRLTLDLARYRHQSGQPNEALQLFSDLLRVLHGSGPSATTSSDRTDPTPGELVRSALYDPDIPMVFWKQTGVFLAHCSRYALAVAAFRRAIELSPEAGDLRLSLSDVLRYGKRHRAALAVIENLPESEPGVFLKRGQALLGMGDIRGAREALLRESRTSPYRPAADALLRIKNGISN